MLATRFEQVRSGTAKNMEMLTNYISQIKQFFNNWWWYLDWVQKEILKILNKYVASLTTLWNLFDITTLAQMSYSILDCVGKPSKERLRKKNSLSEVKRENNLAIRHSSVF